MKAKPPDDDPAQARLVRIRHSLAHVMAQAVLELRPGTKLGFGPPIEDGFFFDFVLSQPLSEQDFPELERRMRAIIERAEPFEHEELPREQALARLEAMGEPYKREYAEELCLKKGLPTLGFYRNGSFLDMCDGPHVGSTGELPRDGFKIRSLAGAYFRGDERRVMMTRLYAWAFASKAELDDRLARYEQDLARDHKRLGRELEIFAFDDEVGKGLPLWLPNGTVLREELEALMKELEFEAGFQRVATPHLARAELYRRTGHLPYYASSTFPIMDNADEEASGSEAYCLKPMNCPHHHKIFAARKRSYRELPLRLAEYGQCYRYEDSGALSGLLRVRGMCMNDAHIYCAREQVAEELESVLAMHQRVYAILGLTAFKVRLSLRDDGPDAASKYVEDPEGWQESEQYLRQALDDSGLPYEEAPGEAAFYAPKIDFQFRTALGREETASTLQLDFYMSRKLELQYVGKDGKLHHPYIIHRAPLGTHERFVALLLEHHAGAFPTWLAPVQVRVLPVAGEFSEYARQIVGTLRGARVRAELGDDGEGLGKRVARAHAQKIPNLLIVGQREQSDGTVTLRRHGSSSVQTLPFAAFRKDLARAIEDRRD